MCLETFNISFEDTQNKQQYGTRTTCTEVRGGESRRVNFLFKIVLLGGGGGGDLTTGLPSFGANGCSISEFWWFIHATRFSQVKTLKRNCRKQSPDDLSDTMITWPQFTVKSTPIENSIIDLWFQCQIFCIIASIPRLW